MISPQHFQEWTASCVDPDLINLNVLSLSGNQTYEYLLYSEQISRRNDGRLRDGDLRRYRHLEQGGWWCSGLDPLNNWQLMLWGCFKPDHPRRTDDGKIIKYEHPPKAPTRAFFLRVPLHIWQKLAKRYGIAMPEDITVTADGEALGFWAWVLDHPEIPIQITEGAKKAGALLSTGVVAVALPGITGGFRHLQDEFGEYTGQRHLIPELAVLAARGREIRLCFDRDTKQKTVKAVNSAIATTGLLLGKQGCTVKVISWVYQAKGVDDLIADYGIEAFEEAYQSAQLLEQWQTHSYSQLTYTPNVLMNQQYLGELQIPNNAKLIGIKAPKGTGKTKSLADVATEAYNNGQWVLVLTHRVQLGEELCRRLGVPYVTELRSSVTGKLFGFGLCVDSLHPKSQARFSAENWRNGVVILDEAEQVIWHMLNSSTCQLERVPILREFKQLIINNLRSEQGRVILSDADLSDISVDYILGLGGMPLTPWILVNEWKPKQGWDVLHYRDKTPAGIVAALEKHIAEGGKPFVCCTSQKVKGHYSTNNLEATFRKRFPRKKILRIDSETIANPKHPAYGCITHLDKVLQKYDVVIASPSLETGVSIDLKGHFTSVWGVFQGVQAENSARQFLARIRALIERHIWVAPYGIGKIGNGSISIKSLLSSQQQLAKLNINLLRDTDFQPEDVDENFCPISLRTWAKMACRVNQGMIHYRESVLDGLSAEGHSIIEVSSNKDISKTMKKTLSQTSQEERSSDAQVHADAADIEPRQYDLLKEKSNKTPEERQQERKYFLKMRYGVDVTPELVLKDSDGWYPQIQLHYYLTAGREYLPLRERKRLREAREKGKGLGTDGKDAIWMPDFNRGQLVAVVTALEKLGILPLLDPEREFRGSDPDLQQLAARLKADPWGVKVIFHLTINEKDSPIAIVQMLLSKLGLKLTLIKQDGTGKRERVYRFIPPDDTREKVFAAWQTRDLTSCTTATATLTAPEEQPCTEELTHTPGNKEYIENQGCEEVFKPSKTASESETVKNYVETPQYEAKLFCAGIRHFVSKEELLGGLTRLSEAARVLIEGLLRLPEFCITAERYWQLMSADDS